MGNDTHAKILNDQHQRNMFIHCLNEEMKSEKCFYINKITGEVIDKQLVYNEKVKLIKGMEF
jgi:hypothetical protein